MVTLLAALAIQSSVSPIDGIPGLKMKVSMHETMMPLDEFAQGLARLTHAHLSVAKEIRDRKIGVFFDDRPAAEAMHRLETALFLQWVPDGDGLKLVLPKQIRVEEQSILNAETSANRKYAEEKLDAWIEASREPYESVMQQLTDLQSNYSNLEKDTSEVGKRRLADAYNELMDLSDMRSGRSAWAVGGMLDRLGPQGSERLFDGLTLAASGDPIPGSFRMDPDSGLLGNLFPGMHYTSFVFIDPSDGQLKIIAHNHDGSSTSGSTIGFQFGIYGDRRVDETVKSEPLIKRLEAWQRVDNASLIATPVRVAAAPSNRWLQKTLTVSDQLECLYQATGIPILCDACRLPATYCHPIQGSTVEQWLDNLGRQVYGSLIAPLKGMYRTEEGWILFRHPKYWRLLESEIPERSLKSLESVLPGPPTLAMYAQFAASLTPAQMTRIDPTKLVTRFPLIPMLGNVNTLRMWAGLAAGEQDLALRGILPAAEMGTSSQELYLQSMHDLAYAGAVPDRFLVSLMPGARLPDDMGLMVRTAAEENASTSMSLGEDLPEPDKKGDAYSRDSHKYRGYLFRFGTSREMSIAEWICIGESRN